MCLSSKPMNLLQNEITKSSGQRLVHGTAQMSASFLLQSLAASHEETMMPKEERVSPMIDQKKTVVPLSATPLALSVVITFPPHSFPYSLPHLKQKTNFDPDTIVMMLLTNPGLSRWRCHRQPSSLSETAV